MRRLLFLWSLWNVHNPSVIHQHVVIQTPPSFTTTSDLLQVVEQVPHLQQPYRKMICFSNEATSTIQTDEMTVVPLIRVFRSREHQFLPHHDYLRSNYLLFSNSMYPSVMGYADFCCMQDKLADIVLQYVEDEKNPWMIWMDDPLLMATVRSYGTKKAVVDRTSWITMQKESFHDHILIGDVSKTFR